MKLLKFLLLFTLIAPTFACSQYSGPLDKDLISFQDTHGNNLQVKVDPKTGSAHRVYGELPNVDTYGFKSEDLDEISVEHLSKKLFDDYAHVLKINATQTKLVKAETDSQCWFVSYEQSVNDVPVYGTEIGYTLNQKGDIISFGEHVYQNISISTTPGITKSEAEETARKAFASDASVTERECVLIIYPKEDNGATKHFLAWKITLSRLVPLQDTVYFIDAQKGTIIDQKNNIMDYQISGKVSGNYWPVYNYDQTANAAFPTTNIQIIRNGQVIETVNSNTNGNYSTSNNLSNVYYTVKFPLQSDWVQVRDSSENILFGSIYCKPGTNKNMNHSASDGTNLRWHVAIFHNWVKSTFNYTAMDYQMSAYVNMGPNVNGSASGWYICFGSYNNQQWARSSSTVYHEYAHNVVYHIYGTWIGWGGGDMYSEGSAMDEGIADYFACTKTNNPQPGTDCGNTRTLSNNYTWDPNQDKYFNCQVIGGACWDLRGVVGQTVADNLVFKALQMTPHPHSFSELYENTISADGAYYGSSHISQIYWAFCVAHGIAP